MPAHEPQHNNKKTLKIRTLLETFAIISVFYAGAVLVAGLGFGSTIRPGYLIAFWSVASVSSWLCALLGLLSAQGHRSYVQLWRFGLLFALLLQVTGAVALLPKKIRTYSIWCYYIVLMTIRNFNS